VFAVRKAKRLDVVLPLMLRGYRNESSEALR
jgi:hypothetical protein